MQKTVNKRIRRVSQSFAIRLDLLEKLEAEAPKGERSAFLERLLVREFGSPARAQANQVGYKRKNPAISNFGRGEITGLNTDSTVVVVTVEGGLAPE